MITTMPYFICRINVIDVLDRESCLCKHELGHRSCSEESDRDTCGKSCEKAYFIICDKVRNHVNIK